MSNMSISGSASPMNAQLSGQRAVRKNETDKNSDNGIISALKPKTANSREEMIRNRIEDLREQLAALADAKELDSRTKDKMRENINKQLSDLNIELLDARKQREEQEAEKAENGSVRSKKFDRYEPSEALKNLSSSKDAGVALEQAEIQLNTNKKLENRSDILKNEITADVANGVPANEKEEELVDIRARLRDADHKAEDDPKDPDESDGPTYITYNTGLVKIAEMRQRAAEQANRLSGADEEGEEETVIAKLQDPEDDSEAEQI